MMEIALLGFVCFVVGALAGAMTTLILAAVVAGGRADHRLEDYRNRRKE